MKKIKIIDLLNKIANGEETPRKIKVDGKIYEYQGDDYGHKQDDDDNGIITSWLFTDNEIEKYDYISEFLNDEVEIIDDEYKEIKPLTKQDIEALGYACGEIQKCFTNGWNKSLENKSFKEDKKIEKLDSLNTDYYTKEAYYERLSKEEITLDIQTLKHWINKIIDYLMENKQ